MSVPFLADPWLVASSELNKLDMREFFADIRSPPPRYLSDDLLPRDLDMESGTKWINRSLSGLAGERDADEVCFPLCLLGEVFDCLVYRA